jgi:hypothetical protein
MRSLVTAESFQAPGPVVLGSPRSIQEAPRWNVALKHVGVSKIVTGDENRHDGGHFPAGVLVSSILMER